MRQRHRFQCTHYTVKNGKLVPRPSTPEKKVNYKYIPYSPLNKPHLMITTNQLLMNYSHNYRISNHQSSQPIQTSTQPIIPSNKV